MNTIIIIVVGFAYLVLFGAVVGLRLRRNSQCR